MAWSKRARRRALLLGLMAVIVAGGVFAGRAMLDWRRARAFEETRASGLEAFAQSDHESTLRILGPLFRQASDDLELVRAVAIARVRVVESDGGHLARAAVLFQRVLELDPDDLQSRRELLRIYLSIGFLRETLDTADAILEAAPGDHDALEVRVQVLAAMGRWTEASEDCARLVAADPGSARWKQLQISTALASGLSPTEAAELAAAWPKGDFDDGLDEMVLAALFAMAGEPDQSGRLVDSAVQKGAGDGKRLASMLSILADLGRGAEAERLIRGFAMAGEVGDSEFVRVAGDWAFAAGRADFLIELLDAMPVDSPSRCWLLVPLALLAVDGEPEDRDRWLGEADACRPDDEELRRSREAVLLAAKIVQTRDIASFRSLSDSAGRPGSSVLEKLAASRAALAIGDALAARRWAQAAEAEQRTLAGGVMMISASQQRGEIIAAAQAALDLLLLHPNRVEPASALVMLWSDAGAVPAEFRDRVRQQTGAADPLSLANRLVELFGLNSVTAVPFAAAAVSQRRPDLLEDVVVALIAAEPAPTLVLLDLHRRIRNYSPLLADRLKSRLIQASGDHPMVIALAADSEDGSGAWIDDLRASLPLEADDSAIRSSGWTALLSRLDGLPAEDFRRVASDAIRSVPGDPIIVSRILYDTRTWEDEEFAKGMVDRSGQLLGERSVEHALALANWTLLFDRDNQAARVSAISRLNEHLLEDSGSYAIGVTLLRLMIADSASDPQSALRLGRQLVADRPGALELYPIVIGLMQSQGMLADAERLLREFEAIDASGEVSARQRASTSFLQGNLEDLVRSLTRVTDRSGAATDALNLGRAKEAVGDLAGAEQAYRAALKSDDLAAEAMVRLGMVMQRMGRITEFEAMLRGGNEPLSEFQRELALAELQLSSGSPSSAAERLRRLAKDHPQEPLAWRSLGVAMLATGDRLGAAEAAMSGLQIAPDSEELQSIVAIAALEDGSVLDRLGSVSGTLAAAPQVIQEAMRVLRSARGSDGRFAPDLADLQAAKELCSRFGDSLVAWRVATALYQYAGESAEARALASAASRRFPNSSDPVHWQVIALTALGQLEAASALCTDWRRLRFPDIRLVDETQAALELARNRPDAAIVLLRRHRDLIVRDAALRPGPYRALLASLMMTGAVREAAEIERANLAASEQSRTTWAEIAAMAPYERGLEAMSILEASSPADAGSRARMISRWVAFHERHPNGRGLDRARALLPRTGTSPADYDARLAAVARADIERVAGDAAAAQASLQSVLDSYPPTIQERAKTLGALAGQAQFDLFREIEPLLYARNNLAMLLVEQDTSLDAALSLVQESLEVLPGNPDLRDTQAQVLLKLGRLSEAEQSSVMAIRAYPTNPAVLLTGAEILAAGGRVAESRLLVQRVRDILAQEPWPSQQVEGRLRRVAESLAAGS